jgi:HEPN domain-containing protein
MSEEKHQHEAERWISQGEEDLDAARVLLEGEKYAQACFYCQQSGEKAMKGFAWSNGLDLWGHSLLKLCDKLKEHDVQVAGLERRDMALLDKFYIPTRYPNGLPEITPQKGFCREEAEEGMKAAKRILKWVRKHRA